MIEDILSITPIIVSLYQCNYVIDGTTAVYLYLYTIDPQRAQKFNKIFSLSKLEYTVGNNNFPNAIGSYKFDELDYNNNIKTRYLWNGNKSIILKSGNEKQIFVIDKFHQPLQIRNPLELIEIYKYAQISSDEEKVSYFKNELQYIKDNILLLDLKEVMDCGPTEYKFKNKEGQIYVESKGLKLQEKTVTKKSGCV
jgi:hypothetical protein